jgi:flagellar biosynthesis/type III secretory pathway chaperone
MLNLEESVAAISPFEQIIDALRAELQEYGALLSVFDAQQQAILERKPDDVLELEGTITAQLGVVRTHRTRRESLLALLGNAATNAAKPTLFQSILQFPQPMRPLVEALATEVNRLISKVRRRAQQNQMLLKRTIEVTQELCERLQPGSTTRTYARDGKMKIKAAAGAGRLLEHS